jgi:predicted Zn finger-like uncharacterized protein
MIIRCRKCETRFRFDESVMEGDGAWVRCSRCQNVFFQERPAAETAEPAAAVSQEVPTVRISDARPPLDDRFPPAEERPLAGDRPSVEAAPDFGTFLGEAKEKTLEHGAPEAMGDLPLRESDREAESEEPEEDEELTLSGPDKKRGMGTLLKILVLILFTLLLLGGVYLWLFPEARHQAYEWASPWLKAIPGMEQLLGKEEAKKQAAAQPLVGIKDIQQRTVTNLLSGNLRILEGVAVNQSPSPLSRIRVRLVISDAYDVVLGEKTVFCGNLLTDVELSTLAEPEILRELSFPQGSDVPNEKIPPGGTIPFMIVFAQEQAGAIKTIVMPAGADQAL